jgi:hypothetical protein
MPTRLRVTSGVTPGRQSRGVPFRAVHAEWGTVSAYLPGFFGQQPPQLGAGAVGPNH